MNKSIFEPVKLKWGDEEKEIPANRVMELIILLEDHISFEDLIGNPKRGKLSNAYSEGLRFAGFSVTTEEVYSQMFSGASLIQIQNAIAGIQQIMIPPATLKMYQKQTKEKKTSQGKS